MENIRRFHEKALEASKLNQSGLMTYEEMKREWDAYLQESEKIVARLEFKNSTVYGYQRDRESENADTEHILVEEDLVVGSFHRNQGDTLCRKLEEFEGIEALDLKRPPNCILCLETAQKIIYALHPKI